ncbi:Cables1, partial [Symbiodinium microadriaticum]
RKFLHDPDILDDTELVQGKHRHVMRGDALTGPVMSSVILYVNAKDLKDDLNNKFREKHPNLPQSISLSKIRNLKTSALLGCLSLGIEMSTIAIAFILFEHLCLKGVVTKTNRRLSMAVCLVLAIKFNEPVCKDSEDAILEFADRQWSIPKKE